jgi:hypothetical protein
MSLFLQDSSPNSATPYVELEVELEEKPPAQLGQQTELNIAQFDGHTQQSQGGLISVLQFGL